MRAPAATVAPLLSARTDDREPASTCKSTRQVAHHRVNDASVIALFGNTLRICMFEVVAVMSVTS